MRILFVCSFGGAKSVIAASQFNRLAAENALPYEADAVAADTPYDAVLPAAAEVLARDGHDVASFKPRQIEHGEANEAARIITIGCNVDGVDAERWDDVPNFSDGPERSAAAIEKHVQKLIDELRRG